MVPIVATTIKHLGIIVMDFLRRHLLWLLIICYFALVTAPVLAQDADYYGDDALYDEYDEYAADRAIHGGVYDPLEPVNRAIHGLNQVVDTLLLEPIARGYVAVTPYPVRDGVSNMLDNLREPVNMANALMQGDVAHGFVSFWRFILNSTFGVAGLFDFASANTDLTYRREDFGQTLGHYGIGHGPYLVLPLMGPSSLRDAIGFGVDVVIDPMTYALGDGTYIRAGVTVLDSRADALPITDDIDANALDPYATYRSTYLQYRAKQVEKTHTDMQRYYHMPRCRS